MKATPNVDNIFGNVNFVIYFFKNWQLTREDKTNLTKQHPINYKETMPLRGSLSH